ncbi:MAG: ABC transporter ATP-binding protein, partial [Candidatus Aenigmarchaeota archaeon]|nr:ABC transporter ATP-binding protein [Candidatus Aenigmarchaeota archaeon]
RALVRNPKVWLMDEPLSNLDAKLRVYMRAELKKLQKDLKITTIYVTHDQAEAMAMADRVAVMNKGKLMQYDSPHVIYERPANLFVGGFVGAPPMNFIEANIVEEGEQTILETSIFKYSIDSELANIIKSRATSERVILGFRPENLLLSIDRRPESIFQADLYVIEPMGSNIIVDLKAGEYLLKAVLPPTTRLPQIGEKVWAYFPPDKLHIFDAKTEHTII